MLLDELRARKAEIEALARKHGAGRIRVFGSVARYEDRPGSDVDLLVELPRGYDLFGQRFGLQESLESLVGRQVDLIPEHELNRHIRNEVLAEAVDL